MTSEKLKRCAHCAVVYSYFASGEGCRDPLNSGSYCPDCQEVVLTALKAVARKVKRDRVEVTDVGWGQILEWKKADDERAAKIREGGGLAVRRVAMNLYDLTDPSNRNERFYVGGRGRHEGWSFLADYWTKTGPETMKITAEVEVEAATGRVLGPWRDY